MVGDPVMVIRRSLLSADDVTQSPTDCIWLRPLVSVSLIVVCVFFFFMMFSLCLFLYGNHICPPCVSFLCQQLCDWTKLLWLHPQCKVPKTNKSAFAQSEAAYVCVVFLSVGCGEILQGISNFMFPSC